MKSSGLVLSLASQVGGAQPSATVINDASRFKNNGTGTDITWTKLPSGLWVPNFNGATSRVDILNSKSLDFERTHPFTFNAWIKPTGDAFEGTLWCTLNEAVGGIGIRWKYEGVNLLVFRLTNNHTVTDTSVAQPIIPNVNNMVSITYDGNGFTNGMTSYTNAVLKQAGGGGALVGTTVTTRPHKIGANTENARHFSGTIAHLYIYNYALSAAEIRSIYERERRLFGV